MATSDKEEWFVDTERRFTISEEGTITYDGLKPVTLAINSRIHFGKDIPCMLFIQPGMTDEEWRRLLWLEMWRLIGIEVNGDA